MLDVTNVLTLKTKRLERTPPQKTQHQNEKKRYLHEPTEKFTLENELLKRGSLLPQEMSRECAWCDQVPQNRRFLCFSEQR